MSKRAWCNGCCGYVMLTAEETCPFGHSKPLLRGVEEVGYGAPPSQPELGPPGASSSGGFTPVSAYAAPEAFGGYGAPSLATAVAAPAAAWPTAGRRPAAARGNPWQADIDSMSIDPMLQMQLNQGAVRGRGDVPWIESWVAIAIFLMLLWPVGLLFMWRSPIPTSKAKWTITAVIAALIAIGFVRAMLGGPLG